MLALGIAGVGCSQDSGIERPVTLQVRDGWIREPGTECSGSRPFLYVHKDAAFLVEEGDGEEKISEGSLPAGVAEEAVDEDLEAERVPTFCTFQFTVSVPEPGDYELIFDEGAPLEFSVTEEPSEVTLVLP